MPVQLDITPADKEHILQNFFRNTSVQFKIISTHTSKFGEQRAGYLGDHFLLTFNVIVTSSESDDPTVQEIKLFVKALPQAIPSLATYLQETNAFSKEAQLFRELIPRLQALGRFGPEALFAQSDELIVFRNLKLEGFRTLQHNDGLLDLIHLEQTLRVLARMHATSFALEAQSGQTLSDLFPGRLDENSWILKENYPRVKELENIIGALCALVKHYEKNGKRRDKLVGCLPECVRQIYELVKSSEVYRNVFSHADLWNNNVMFRYSEHGSPVDCLLVDFQLARYVPPAYDFNMLLSLTTTSSFRRKHLSFLQGYYYQSLRKELTRHEITVEEILTQDEFQDACQLYRKAGAIDSFIINHVTLLPRDILDEVFSSPEQYERFTGESKITECLKAFDGNLSYRTRMVDIIENVVETFELQ
ncbi:uncharacterized protein LOC135699409 [Ochlerotatus camptorhynchus]|uniref:uncharacterized protein LOC135699409 n=1 Tax=Ochlerotatus camptorhynchus TaxID=644619 RepID=UPI0031D0E0E7